MGEEHLINEWLSIIKVLQRKGKRPDNALGCQQAPCRCVWVGTNRPSESNLGSTLVAPFHRQLWLTVEKKVQRPWNSMTGLVWRREGCPSLST